jgi:hypothetical protein
MIGDETNHTQSGVSAVSPVSRLQSGQVDEGWADEAAPAAPNRLPARPMSRMRDIAVAAVSRRARCRGAEQRTLKGWG